MKREIVWTTKFKKDYKLAMKRHMDIGLLDGIIRALSRGENFQRRTKTTSLPAIGWGIRNVTFSRTGYSSTGLRTMCWC